MIHTLFVTKESQPEALLKEFRKRLMTGGAVVRLHEELSEADLDAIVGRFLPCAKRYNLASLVLEEIARSKGASTSLREKLVSTKIPEIENALSYEQS